MTFFTQVLWFCCPSLRFTIVSTALISPMIWVCAIIFLLISAGSISICRIFAFFAKESGLPNTLSLNLVPMAISRSQAETPRLDVLVPCMPSMPVYRASVPSKAPLPISVSATGAWTFSTNSLSSSDASESTAPPPTSINGFLDDSISSMACRISISLILSIFLLISFGLCSL